MTTIRDIFTAYAPEYIERHPHLPTSHRKAIDALCHCRTGAYGSSLSACPTCGPHHRVNHAGGHRHCPQCQHHKAQRWWHNQLQKQLPGPYFLITCTVPGFPGILPTWGRQLPYHPHLHSLVPGGGLSDHRDAW